MNAVKTDFKKSSKREKRAEGNTYCVRTLPIKYKFAAKNFGPIVHLSLCVSITLRKNPKYMWKHSRQQIRKKA